MAKAKGKSKGKSKTKTVKANAPMQATAFAAELADRTGISKTDVRHLLDEIGDVVREEIAK